MSAHTALRHPVDLGEDVLAETVGTHGREVDIGFAVPIPVDAADLPAVGQPIRVRITVGGAHERCAHAEDDLCLVVAVYPTQLGATGHAARGRPSGHTSDRELEVGRRE